MSKLYHVSNIGGLKTIEPRVSTHGTAYVYATDNFEFALFFGTEKSHGDFDGMYGIRPDGKAYFYESFPGSFKDRFEGQSCFVYELNPDTFEKGKTSFIGEVVSTQPVQVLRCIEIKDTYNHLQELIQEGKIDFKEYNYDKDYKQMMESHVEKRMILFDVINHKESRNYAFCKEQFPEILKKLEEHKF